MDGKNMRTPPLLSIVIPAFNRVKSLTSLIESIGPKHDDLLEIVITDDSDNPQISDSLKLVCSDYPNIFLYKNQENLGMVKNWNECIKKASGKWICFMCDDDLFYPDGVDRIIELIKNNDTPCLIVQSPQSETSVGYYKSGVETVKHLKLPLVSGNVWHREITDYLGCFDERIMYSPDAEFWYRIAYNYPVIKVKKPFAQYISHENNYAYTTWEKKDFLDQVGLICSINALYFYGEHAITSEHMLEEIERAKKETINTILSTTCMLKNKTKIFKQYYRIGLENQKGIALSFRFFIIKLFFKNIITTTKSYIKNVHKII